MVLIINITINFYVLSKSITLCSIIYSLKSLETNFKTFVFFRNHFKRLTPLLNIVHNITFS